MPEFNPDKVTIKDLAVEEPEKESGLPFDVERDITEADWENMTETARKLETHLFLVV